jgi:3-methylcrotonyl-CoA carboxylase alpha subunit
VIERLGPVLIANRGEIAIRIMRTCRRLGLRTVAVYSDADARSLHVGMADSAVHIGPSPAARSYLDQRQVLAAARQSGARSIHPGYGFLAENPEFAQRVVDAGLTWIGPSAAAMRLVGDKAHAKALAEQHGVPVLAGYHGPDQSGATLAANAERIGYPLLIKASAGGGGRGMRVVESVDQFAAALEAARREATASFADDRVLLERYVSRPRHVEVQILGDMHSNLIHLGERECSIQRRHQKLIEESPSPAVDAGLRQRMGEAALRLARAAGYASAGTVEFLLEEDGRFAFLEVNARLQVEHPVTEAITGLDLVEQQLRVAAGEQMAISQNQVQFTGHAIEARVIAEDPLAGFLPSSGTLRCFDYPDNLRVDTWATQGTRVSPYYDSLLAKVIVHAESRLAAAAKLADFLRRMRIDGVRHNVDLLLATIEAPEFLRGELHTAFLEEHQVVKQLSALPDEVLAAVSAVDHLRPSVGADDPWRAHSGWRLGRSDQPAAWTRAGVSHSATVSADLAGDGLFVTIGERRLHVRLGGSNSGPELRPFVDGEALTIWDHSEDWRVVEWQARSYRLRRTGPPTIEDTAGASRGGGPGRLAAPMPGRIVKVAVQEGQHVAQNQPLVVLEAMKMEHVIEAPHAGVVTDLRVALGDQIASGALLLTIDSA